MTYGEAVMFQKSTMRMQNGVWVSDPLPAHVRLSEQEALEYYGRKLDKYWASLPPSKPTQEPTQEKRHKKEPLPPSVIERLLEIKGLAQKGLEATAMTTKDTKLRTIIKRVGKPEKGKI
jgi:hypothetical protein|nr:MAG TPA: hypothetical protein [Caudoviricetes sp.]